jgi:branched-chain amino acid transport system ATP-binding protein
VRPRSGLSASADQGRGSGGTGRFPPAARDHIERPTVIDVRDLHVYLGASHVLQGVSFSVREGGVTALLGRNGVGKTTTLRALLGLVQPRGMVTLDGSDLTKLRTHQIVRRGVGYVPEDREIFAGLTVDENLRLAERNGQARYELVYELFPELRERGRQRAGTLSGGQQQMVAIARALLNENRVLLIDEPTKGLAPLLVTQVADVLERLSELSTILLVEQNLGVVERIARDVVVLDQGRVAHTGPAAELLADQALVRRLLGVARAEH